MNERESFLGEKMGNLYYEFHDFAIIVAIIGTPLFLILFGLTFICHFGFLCDLFSIVSGFSLLFGIYIFSLIYLADNFILYKVCRAQPSYTVTVVWFVILVVIGVYAVVATHKYKKQYRFDCTEWIVDEREGLYHWNERCDYIGEDTYTAKGYKIRDKGLILCEYCEEEMDGISSSYEPIRRP